MPSLRVIRARLPKGVLLWGSLSTLLAIGTLTAILDLTKAPKAELALASEQSQHVTIDPVSGAIRGLPKKEEPPAALPATPAAPATTPTTNPADPTTPAATPAQTGTTETPTNTPALPTQPPVAAIPPIKANGESLVVPPAAEITQHEGDMALPYRGDKEASAASLYSKSFTPQKDHKMVSIVITDAGYNAQTLALILKLPHTVTVAISPYAPEVTATITKLHQAGYETWGMLPMMGATYPQKDPGPLGLISTLPPEEVTRRLHMNMNNTLGSVGMVLPADETLSTHAKTFVPVLEEIYARGLFLLSLHNNQSIERLAGKNQTLLSGIHHVDLAFDANATPAEIQSKLDGLQPMLTDRNALIIAVPAQPQILTILNDWLAHNGLGPSMDIAPLSEQYHDLASAPIEAAPTDKKEGGEKPAETKPEDKKPDAAKPAEAKPAEPKKDGK